MAVRACPHCKTEISAPESAARSNDIECPKCATRLEVAPGSRTLSSLAGLAGGAIAWRLSAGSTTELGGVLPTLYAFLAFGVVSPIVLAFTASLRNAPAVPVFEPAHTSGPAAHGGGHH
jgi:DNA-directed RNA polymerase subunit RPC12/RpoP